ncbi:hypothetical protein NVP1161O_163 [Vibrio phage 1.161.O._10N.261.48.C5]|nr:hypothetical protein NVP1161O_163 [Vibrio phage 1.161.O._10N.261.48.C5]
MYKEGHFWLVTEDKASEFYFETFNGNVLINIDNGMGDTVSLSEKDLKLLLEELQEYKISRGFTSLRD